MLTTEEKTVPTQVGEKLPRPLRVCFVCTGNTCRSPMAAAVANDLACKPFRSLPESVRGCAVPAVEAVSAGLFANVGEPISRNAVQALEQAGVLPVPEHDFHTHTARNLTQEGAAFCDLIIAMTPGHAQQLLMAMPDQLSKIRVMPEPVPDPYGGDLAAYAACLEKITDGVRKLLFPGDGES